MHASKIPELNIWTYIARPLRPAPAPRARAAHPRAKPL